MVCKHNLMRESQTHRERKQGNIWFLSQTVACDHSGSQWYGFINRHLDWASSVRSPNRLYARTSCAALSSIELFSLLHSRVLMGCTRHHTETDLILVYISLGFFCYNDTMTMVYKFCKFQRLTPN